MPVLDYLAASTGNLSLCALLISACAAHASTVAIPNDNVPRGAAIAQSFLGTHGNNISLLATAKDFSCVASHTLPIELSIYVDANGTAVDFKDVIRSPASSIQAIARRDAETEFRIQLKYSPDPAKTISLDIAGKTLDLTMSLEPSGDSLWLTGADARTLADALQQGDIPKLSGTSSDSGRRIIDQITAPDMAGLDACRITLDELLVAQHLTAAGSADPAATVGNTPLAGANQEGESSTTAGLEGPGSEVAAVLVSVEEGRDQPTLPQPVTGMRLEFVARPDPETRIAPSELEECRMRNIPENVYLGRLTKVTGFFSQTQDVYVAFDEQGHVHRAYIPGIFDSELRLEGGSARVSFAADTNLPDEANLVKGCLGDALIEAPVCVSSEEGSDRYTIAECGVLGMSEDREDMVLSLESLTLQDLTGSSPLLASTTLGSTRTTGFAAGFGRLGGGSSTGIGYGRGRTPLAIFDNVPGTLLDGSGGLPGGDGGQDFGRDRTPLVISGNVPGSFIHGGGGLSGGDGGRRDGDNSDVSPVPLPAGIWLMLSALIGISSLAGTARRRQGIPLFKDPQPGRLLGKRNRHCDLSDWSPCRG